jgi:putative transposase
MIDSTHDLSIKRQAQPAGISRRAAYYLPQPVSQADLDLMRRVGVLHLEHPFMDTRMLRDMPKRQRDRQGEPYTAVGRNMSPHTDAAHWHQRPVRQAWHWRQATRPHHLPVSAAWHVDRAHKPGLGDRHHLHPVGQRRRVPDGGDRRGKPQSAGLAGSEYLGGVSFHGGAGTGVHPVWYPGDSQHGPRQSIHGRRIHPSGAGARLQTLDDGRGAWRDNMFVERLWRTVKHEEVDLYTYESAGQARSAIDRHLHWYNESRPHSSLGKQTPKEAYAAMLPAVKLAA